MIIYLSGNNVTDMHINYLTSYFYILNGMRSYDFEVFVEKKRGEKMNKISLFLDSGAYTAFTKRVEINIQDYIDFIKEHAEDITVYANLDVIGDAEATLRNQKIMEQAGLKPLPCFHRGEDWKYLDYYISNYDYIALGGVAQRKGKNYLIAWMNRCWDIICDTPDGMPRCKVHGFGVTALDIMMKYPWYSVDSTSWVLTSRSGSIYVPRFRGGRYVYDQNTWKIPVSAQNPAKAKPGGHFETLSPSDKRIVLNYIESKGFSIGKSEIKSVDRYYKLQKNERWYKVNEREEDFISIEEIMGEEKDEYGRRLVEVVIEPGLCNDYRQRDAINIMYFLDLEKNFRPWPWSYKRKGIEGFGLRG